MHWSWHCTECVNGVDGVVFSVSCYSDENARLAVEAGVIDAVVLVMKAQVDNADVSEAACRILIMNAADNGA